MTKKVKRKPDSSAADVLVERLYAKIAMNYAIIFRDMEKMDEALIDEPGIMQ